MTGRPFDTREFRSALGAFMTGVTVVTTLQDDGVPRGLTANSFSSVSLDPPLVLVCIARTAATYPLFAERGHFAINILAEDQKGTSSTFASSRVLDKFAEVPWRGGQLGSPLIEGTCAWFECRTHQRVEAGDHMILIGEVVDFDATPAMPLGYCRGAYIDLALSQSAISAAGDYGTRVGAILEQDGGILFDASDPGRLRLPVGASLGPVENPRSLLGMLSATKPDAQLGFLFSVYEEIVAGAARTSIFYYGTAGRAPPTNAKVSNVAIDSIPWEGIEDNERWMLQRYLKERQEGAFGVYSGHNKTIIC